MRVEDELSEERVKLVVLHQGFVKLAQHFVDEGQLLLQQEVVAEVPLRVVTLLSLGPHVVFEPEKNEISKSANQILAHAVNNKPVPQEGAQVRIHLRGDSIAQWLAYLLPHPAALGLIHSIPVFFQRKNCQC